MGLYLDGSSHGCVAGIQLLAVSPSSGSVRGGVSTVIKGSNFLSAHSTFCKFGDGLPRLATVLSSSEIGCRTPPHVAGLTEIRISMNSDDFSNPVAFAFRGKLIESKSCGEVGKGCSLFAS